MTCLIIGGILVSAGLAMLEMRRAEVALRAKVTQRVALTARNLQGLLAGLYDEAPTAEIIDAIDGLLVDHPITAVRVRAPGRTPIEWGQWPYREERTMIVWPLASRDLPIGDEIDLGRRTLIQAPFALRGRTTTLELIVDGPLARAAHRGQFANALAMHWILLGLMVLIGLLMLRRWFTGPLTAVMQLVQGHSGPEPFRRLARQEPTEFGQLASAIAGMIDRLDYTTNRLRSRERAFESLYQFAPAAMVSLDPEGRIIEANRRAAALLHVHSELMLIGRHVLDFVRPNDRPTLRQTIDRLDLDDAARCELRLAVKDLQIDVAVESVGVRDEDGLLQSVRLSMLDISELRGLHRRLEDNGRVLKLILDHMSDGILLVDARGRIAACNAPLARLLQLRPEQVTGQNYDPKQFWQEMGVENQDMFLDRLRQIESDPKRPAQERFHAKHGVFLFQGIPVHDAAGETIGRLWVVQEITSQVQSQRLLMQQTGQLQALKRIGQHLFDVGEMDELIGRTCVQLYDLFGVEAIGLALRGRSGSARSRQVLHRGAGPYLMDQNRQLVQVVETSLLPQVLAHQNVAYWPDLPRKAPWAKAFDQAGFTSVAAVPLIGRSDAHGIFWIARRGGERIEPHLIYLLEAVAPLITARIEITQLHDRMTELQLNDDASQLPTMSQLRHEITRLAEATSGPWSMIVLRLDRFKLLSSLLGYAATTRVLRQVGSMLRRVTRRDCFCVRLHSSTFAVLCPGLDIAAADGVAQRILRSLRGLSINVSENQPWELTASIGVAGYPEDQLPQGQVLAAALSRAELARRSGRGRVVSDSPLARRDVG